MDGETAVEVELSRGRLALIDVADWSRIAPYRWYAALQGGRWYDLARPRNGKRGGTKLRTHRAILDAASGQEVDHVRSLKTLDNRRSNLRFCSNSFNRQNPGSHGGSSRFKNASGVERRQQWRAAFLYGGQHFEFGYFDDDEEAARAETRW